MRGCSLRLETLGRLWRTQLGLVFYNQYRLGSTQALAPNANTLE
jgi:hypothetical protein